MEKSKAKEAAAEKALTYVQEGMIVGLGTGSTASFFIEKLGRRGVKITAVASSEASLELAKRFNIPVKQLDEVSHIDLTIDGADAIDPQFRMIKGGGGALLREKILASNSHTMIAIVDSSKVVSKFGKFNLPVEIIPFGYTFTLRQIEKLGISVTLRPSFITDNGNLIADLKLPDIAPEELDRLLKTIPGVVETGFFFNIAKRLIIGYDDGHVDEKINAAIE